VVPSLKAPFTPLTRMNSRRFEILAQIPAAFRKSELVRVISDNREASNESSQRQNIGGSLAVSTASFEAKKGKNRCRRE
jgi:hypothetical protein